MTIIYKNIYNSMFIFHFYNYILFTDNHIRVIIMLLCLYRGFRRVHQLLIKRFYIILYEHKGNKKISVWSLIETKLRFFNFRNEACFPPFLKYLNFQLAHRRLF